MLFNSAEEIRKVKVFAVEGNEQNFDRLEARLKQNMMREPMRALSFIVSF